MFRRWNMMGSELALNTAQPIISVQGLLRVGEERRPDMQEVCQADTLSLTVLIVILVLDQVFQNLLSPDTVALHSCKNLSQQGRWRRFFLILMRCTPRRHSVRKHEP